MHVLLKLLSREIIYGTSQSDTFLTLTVKSPPVTTYLHKESGRFSDQQPKLEWEYFSRELPVANLGFCLDSSILS